MKLFIAWITIQLMLIGTAFVQATNEVSAKTYNCHYEKHSPIEGALFPLAVFIPSHPTITEYCKGRS